MIEIYVLNKPSEGQRAAFKQAKQNLGIAEPMKFVPASAGCGRLIVFGQESEGQMPEFAAQWITLFRDGVDDVTDALAWYCRLREDWRAADLDLWLEHALGRAGVRELRTVAQ